MEFWSNRVCRFNKEFAQALNCHLRDEQCTSNKINLRKVILLIPVLLLFTMISCQSETDKYRVSQIDTISYRMEEMARVYLEIDTAKINDSYNTILYNIDKLNSLSEPDNRKLLIDYGSLKKGFKDFIKNRPLTIEELEVCRKQIEDLKNDASNSFYTDDEFKLYLKHEANASQSLRVQMSYYHTRINSQQSKFENLNPRIERLIDSLTLVKQ